MTDCYRTLSSYIKDRYGKKMRKIALHTQGTCPNRDGLISWQGCYYCNNNSFNPILKSGFNNLSIEKQLDWGIKRIKEKNQQWGIIAYYQSYTNTYGNLEYLNRLFEPSLKKKEVDIISIGTRPDCLGEPVLDFLKKMMEKKEIWLEIGLQSASERSLIRINRGHDTACFIQACERIKKRFPKIHLSTHLIFGLPEEKSSDALKAAEICANCGITSVKIHPLTIVKNTIFEKEFLNGNIQLISESEYIKRTAMFIKHSSKDLVIERISEDSSELLIAPDWAGNKIRLKELICKNLYE